MIGSFSRVHKLAVLILSGAAVTAGTCGCSKVDAPKSLTISGTTYTFPPEQIRGFLSADENGPYVRLIPPGAPFRLEYSDTVLRSNEQGADVPTVARINDVPRGPTFSVEVIRQPSETIVCHSAAIKYNCGILVSDSGIAWSVHFNRTEVDRASSLKEAALAVLSKYRSTHADRVNYRAQENEMKASKLVDWLNEDVSEGENVALVIDRTHWPRLCLRGQRAGNMD